MGGNDAGNVLGPTVSIGIFKVRRTLIIFSIVVIIGALLGGATGVKTASTLVKVDVAGNVIINISAILVILIFLSKKLPIAVTQAIIGANIGVGLVAKELNIKLLLLIIIGWFLTPILSFVMGFIFYRFFALIFRGIKNLQMRNTVLYILLWIFTLYGAFSLGANNAGKISGILYASGYDMVLLLLMSGLSLALGIVLLGKQTIYTVGRELMPLDDFSSMVTVFSSAFSIWFFSLMGLPVSASHAAIGSITGVGYSKGVRIQNETVFKRILFSWIEAPLYGGLFSALLFSVYRLLW
ncbi:MAG TPA: inorganic phosphate transporter [Fervidobacterium sp.]|nr:inorganic phosphate transporter [Fervidobacterium sp.]HPT54267.1 inorganic phosphate transporter [Fervidobacterium sp.]HPZ17301.1 inorganic phosphate transporter [Fervidobacterium sp.]HQE48372.1 inorganic phosphate transporter [Fervidobacterium sp.]HUM42091.1 inorganic phosphate transporter [Fervidobacterium sp.]